MSEKIRLIIDTDPGQDDAPAILMAHGLAKRGLIEFMALTVVAGNVSLHHTATNARIICDWHIVIWQDIMPEWMHLLL